jgi:histone H3/H4
MSNPEYQKRLKTRKIHNSTTKRKDATLIVDAFEKFINAVISDRKDGSSAYVVLSEAREELISFLCQQSTK